MNRWEALIARRGDLPELVCSLQWMVEALLNRPGAEDWSRGLLRPEVVPHDSGREGISLSAAIDAEVTALLEEQAYLDSMVPEVPASPPASEEEAERAKARNELEALLKEYGLQS